MKKVRLQIQKYFPSEISFLLVLLVMVISLFIFIEIAEAVGEGETHSVDNSILLMFRDSQDPSKPLGPDRLPFIVRDITSLGSSTVLTLVTLFVVFYLWFRQKRRLIIFVLFASLGGTVLVQLLKLLFARPRPEIVDHLASEITMGFPSGHSAMSTVIYLSIAVLIAKIEDSKKIRIFLISTALFVAFIVGLSRIYLGVHYPTDVLAGWMIGLFWALLCWTVATFIENRKLN